MVVSFTILASMPRNKPRLHLALYARPKHPGTYHYALLTRAKDITPRLTPSFEPAAIKYHLRSTLQNNGGGIFSQSWDYEEVPVHDIALEPRILVSIVIAKIIVPIENFNDILRGIAIYQVNDHAGLSEGFYCQEWVGLAIQGLRNARAIADRGSSWEEIKNVTRSFIGKKKAEGRWDVGWKGGKQEAVATFDLLTAKEVVP